jgi:hypothetical protein
VLTSNPAPRWLRVLALLAALVGAALVLASAWHQDLTYDEPYHMQWARRLLEERVSERRSDPMWNSKTPVMMAHVLAKRTARRAGLRDPRVLMFCARLPGLLCYLAVLGATFWLGRRWLGASAGYLALLPVALDPSLIANSAVATVDAPYTLAVLLALGAGLAYAHRPSGWRAALLGLALSFAFATKFTAFLLLPGVLALPWLAASKERVGPPPTWRARLAHFMALGATATLGVCASYLFVDVAVPLGAVLWKSTLMNQVAQALPGWRLPLPSDFLTGFDISLAHERGRAWAVLILDRHYPDGVWWYYLVSWLLKTPLTFVLAQVVGLVLLLRARPLQQRPALYAIAWNLGLHLVYFSCLFRAQIGYRYLLAGVPLLALLAATGFTLATPTWPRAPRLRVAAGVGLLLALLLEHRPYWGNALAFTNALVQPKAQAFRYLTNSSIDWGQNDERVLPWLERRRRVWPVLHFEPTHVRPGINVMGLNSLAGGGSLRQFRYLREHLNPGGHFGHTYLWFDVDAAFYERMLDEDRRLRARPEDGPPCAPASTLGPLDVTQVGRFPETDEPSPAWVVCVSTQQPVDLGFFAEQGTPMLGKPEWLVREWDRLRPGEAAWYRLDPGVHALAVTRLARYVGHFELRGAGRAGVRFGLRPGRVRKGRPLEWLTWTGTRATPGDADHRAAAPSAGSSAAQDDD